MASLATEYNAYVVLTNRLMGLRSRSTALSVEYQKLIAETIMLRMFYELEHAVEVIVLKLLCGARYIDGSAPNLIRAPFRGQAAARAFMLANNARGRHYLEWTMLRKITANVANILDPSDHFLSTRTNFDGVYEDMRKVRNHVAHNSQSTRALFVPVVQRCFLKTNGISAAKFLVSHRIAVPGYTGSDAIVAQYLMWATTFLKVLTKAP